MLPTEVAARSGSKMYIAPGGSHCHVPITLLIMALRVTQKCPRELVRLYFSPSKCTSWYKYWTPSAWLNLLRNCCFVGYQLPSFLRPPGSSEACTVPELEDP